jgi:hypothetical protein
LYAGSSDDVCLHEPPLKLKLVGNAPTGADILAAVTSRSKIGKWRAATIKLPLRKLNWNLSESRPPEPQQLRFRDLF